MITKPEQRDSLVDQVLKDTFAKVQRSAEFSEQLQAELKQLATSGDLKKAARVTEVLKSTVKETS
jgi:hypothetical protein